MKRLISVLVLLIALSAFVFAGGSAEQKIANDQDQKTKISFSGYLVTGDGAEAAAIAFDSIRTKFLEENPNVVWEEDMLAHDQYSNKIIVDASGDNLPDIFMVKAEWVNNWVENEYMGTLNAFLNNDTEWASGFAPNVFSEFTRDNNVYGMPYRIDTTANLFYNEEILKACGINTFPASLKEFREAVRTIRSHGYIPITAGNLGGWFVDICIFRAFVDRFCGDDWNQAMHLKTGEAAFTDKEFIDALEEFEGLVKDRAFNDDINSIDFIQGYTNFYQGKAAMLFDGSGGILPHTQDAPKEIVDNMRVTKLPEMENGKGVGIPGTAGWAIAYKKNVSPEKLLIIEKFFKAIGSSEFANIQAENNGTHAYQTSNVATSKITPLMNEYNKMMETVPMNLAVTFSPAVLDVMYSGLQEIIIEVITPNELAQKLQKVYELELVN